MNPATVRAIDTAECAETSKSSEGDSASKKSNKIVVYFAQNLPAEKASEVRQLARSQHGAKVEARLSPEVTTVVFAKGKKGKTLDVETLTSGALADFYEAAVTGKWIFGIECKLYLRQWTTNMSITLRCSCLRKSLTGIACIFCHIIYHLENI